jgi:hypothetical protein
MKIITIISVCDYVISYYSSLHFNYAFPECNCVN